MPDWEDEHEHDGGVITETQQEVKKPPLYKVLLHNDDFTTMVFVVYILQSVLHKREADAVQIMLAVHQQGVSVAGVYTYEIARIGKTKAILAPSPRGRTPRKRPWSIPALPAGGCPSRAAMAAPPACSSGLP